MKFKISSSVLILPICLLLLSFNAKAQTTVNIKDKPLTEALAELEKQSGYNFFYSSMLPEKDARVSVSAQNASIGDILDELLKGLPISYEIKPDKQIVLTEKRQETNPQASRPGRFKVKGTVIDETGLPVINAGVLIQGTDNGTVTDLDGRYELEVPSAETALTFSFMGYKSQNVTVGNRSVIDIVLYEDKQFLEESVVVGYGTQKRINLTGSVAMVGSEEMNSRPINNVASGLQGLLPGVTVINASGQPGASNTTIRVRGIGTIGNANPLILVDGVEGDISILNPEDIESVTVLKDAASSAIYGARSANGVLLVTTKKIDGGKGVTKVSLGSYVGFQTPTRLPEMCNATEFMTLDNEARTNVGTPAAWTENDFNAVKNGTNPNYFADTDWIGAVLNDYAPQQNYTLSLNGSVGKSGYMLSYRYLNQEGLTAGSSTGEQRHNVRFKMNSTLLDRLTLSSNIGFTSDKVKSPVNSLTNGGGAIYTAMRIAPNSPIYYTDGSWAYGGGNTNPVAVLNDGGNNTTSSEEISLQEVLNFNILKGWDVSATYNMTSYNGFRETLKKTITFTNPEDGSSYAYNSPDALKNSELYHRQQTFIVQSNFDFSFGQHNLSGVAGMSQEWYEGRSFSATRNNLITEDDPTLNLGDATTMSNDASASSWAIRSGFARVSYNYAERYLFESNLRYDLSSRFAKGNRGGLFPSFSAGWRLSEEDFLSFVKPLFSNIKLRGSWGMLGNQYVGSSDYPYISILQEYTEGISLIGTNATTGYVQSILSNPNLSWEKIKMLDFGLDFSMLDDRLTGSFDWYDKNTEGILLQLNYPAQIGARPSEENAGKVNNRGWELDLNWREQRGDFFYGIGFNLSDVKNKITDLAGNQPDLSGYQIRAVGYPIDAFYGYVADGLMTPEDFDICDTENNIYGVPNVPVVVGNAYQPGDIKYKDISGPDGVPDGRITPEYDKQVIGSNIPRYTYSVRGNVGWKGFDFSAVIQGVGKCDGYLTGTARHAFQDMAAYPQKVHLDRYNVVSNPNPDASYPRMTYNTSFNQSTFSTYWLEDASYLRVKNIQIGYTLPEKIAKKARIDNCRIYLSADNPFTVSNFFYAYDPETPVSSGGYYPQVKTYVIGLNISFK